MAHSSHVPARLSYTKDLAIHREEKPFLILSHLKDGCRISNLQSEKGDEEIMHNVRGTEKSFTLDEHGFCYRTRPPEFQDWDSPEGVETAYLAEVKRILKEEVEGVDHVEIFDWRRRGPPNQGSTTKKYVNLNDPTETLPPAGQVHVDQSPMGVLKRVRLLMGSQAPFLLKGRVRVINVWRPLKTVEDQPLVLCDGRSVKYSDLLEIDLVRRDYVGSVMFPKYRPGYQWYYLDRQTRDEVCLFKNFDSREDVSARSKYDPDNQVTSVEAN
ncbi:MAG: hypothetical protein M1813_001629 [Trichoglossum hirsutum]|nr:MAG: hypothetical protein M1813_001629 [Trichoglossum hirsutum]